MNCKDKYITSSKLTIIGLDKINSNHSIHYLVYKITFKNNDYYYIGQHKTENPLDSYAGSGVLVTYYRKKYGLSNMIKEILFDFDNYNDMDNIEHKLVPIDINGNHDQLCINLMEGGHSNQQTTKMKNHLSDIWSKKPVTEKQRIKNIISQKNIDYWNNKSDEEIKEWQELCRQKNIGENNPMYGKKLKDYMPLDKYEKLIEKLRINGKIRFKKINESRKNKTYEDLYGIDKANEIKQKMSNTRRGKKGHNPLQFMTSDEIHQWKQKISRANSGENNPSYGKCWIYNSQTGERKYIKSEDLSNYIFNNSLWIRGIPRNISNKSGKTFTINRLKRKYSNVNFDEFDYEYFKTLKKKSRHEYINAYVTSHIK